MGKASLFGDDGDGDGGGSARARRGRAPPSAAAAAAPAERGLLGGDDADDDGGPHHHLAIADSEAVLGFNPEFARRFEHNKRREELHRLKEKNPRLAARLERQAAREALGKPPQDSDGGETSSSSSSESEDDYDDLEELAKRDDTDRVLEVLAALKAKDPVIKQPEVRFFDDDDDDEEDGDEKGEGDEEKKEKKKGKPVYLRQVLAEQALAGGGEDEEDEAAEDGGGRRAEAAAATASRIPVYDAEQAKAKAEFLKAAASAEGGGGGGEGVDDDGGEFGLVPRARKPQQAGAAAAGDKDARVQKLLSDYFGADDDKLDPDERFLKRYLAERKWLQDDDDDNDDGGGGGGGKSDDPDADAPNVVDDDLEADKEFLERADEFEHSYNFRFEQAGSHQIVGHPRQIPDAVRRKDDKRAEQRRLKAERKAAERKAAEEEVKRLKNLKKMEIQDKLQAVQEVAGVAAPDATLVDALLEGDFDPDEYDRRMAAAFGEDYYDKGEEEEEAAGADAVLKDARAAELLRQAGAIDEDADDEEVPMPIGVTAPQTKNTKPIDESAAADARAAVSRLMEEYYSLDYEGTAGGIRTRFRYKNVEPSTGGLSIEEILAMDDKTLNGVVSLKLLAPYREGKIRPNYKALQQLREARQASAGKRRRPPPQHNGRGGRPAVQLEREGDGPKPWHAAWKKESQPQPQPPQQQQPQSARAASFAPLSLAGQKRRDGGGGGGAGDGTSKKSKKEAAAPAPAAASGPALTKAQRKNLKRAMKRAAERSEKA